MKKSLLQKSIDFMEHSALDFEAGLDRSFLIVSHVVQNVVPLIDVLKKHGEIIGVIPKGTKQDVKSLKALENRNINLLDIKKQDIKDNDFIKNKLSPVLKDKKAIIIDMGGYFAPILRGLNNSELNIIGIVEDTENGLQKYEKAVEEFPENTIPLTSIARSKIKDFEDYLIGRSIAESTLKYLKNEGKDYKGMTFGVLGLGKVGRGAINFLQNNEDLEVLTFDYNRNSNKIAIFRGLDAQITKESVLRKSDVLICATGNGSIDIQSLAFIKHGAYLSSCTSAEDEFNFGKLPPQDFFAKRPDITFINEGNSANFMFPDEQSETISPYIYLTMAGLIKSAASLERLQDDYEGINTLYDKDVISMLKDFQKSVIGNTKKENTMFLKQMSDKGLSNV
ncbi:MAG: hypothetical protein LBR70_01955 [Lactobacillaceae bacterium]|jgi:adenosylhomocysteinase|nr:hypothetical protein [Lactobacillaceae bacterium]